MTVLRKRYLFVLDIFAWTFIPALALSLRLESLDWWPQTAWALILFTVVTLLVKSSVFFSLNIYSRYWRYADAGDWIRVLTAVGISTLIILAAFVGAYDTLEPHNLAMYRTVPLIDSLLTCLAAGGLRFGLLEAYHWYSGPRRPIPGQRVLVVGAGEAGKMVVREMRAKPQLNMQPVAFVDDDVNKIGTHIQGLPVLGASADIPGLINAHRIQHIVMALPSAPLVRRQEIMALCRQTGLATDNVPGLYEILAGSKTISRTPQFDINYLLHREPVVIAETDIAACLNGATVLITGAGGSIGSELCRQVAKFGPKELILLGHGENSIFEINLDLSLSFPTLTTHPVIADIRDRERIYWIMGQYRPTVVFHAAAHKHVPLMEANIEEAITNNVLGTQNVLQAAEAYGVRHFVLISTDKAINPVSIMGTTKRLAELLVMDAAHRTGNAYIAVRFGNVLGSRGSVIPVFLRQITAGGPITVTHPEMSRYFMSIPEAVQLVLQAMVLGQGGEIFMLDMGKPVRIVDLALDLIKLAGLEPERDIKIVYSGIRPGEKVHEELFMESEHYQRTRHEQIFVATNGNYAEAETVARLVSMASQAYTWAAPGRAQPKPHPPQRQPLLRVPEIVTLEAGLNVEM